MKSEAQSIATDGGPSRTVGHAGQILHKGLIGPLLLVLLLLLLTQGGCYYSHLASGQIKILWRRQPIEDALHDPAIQPDTRALLELVKPVREFAAELGLEVGDQYTSYVDWPEDRLVTTLVRTAPDSAELVEWWFPVIGRLPYKGYFDRTWAEEEAERLREQHAYDVCVSGVTAYSTLGWLDDPVTTPMLGRGAASLVETLLHELVHATAFLPDAADFNESVAQFIGQQAAIRFFEEHKVRETASAPGHNSAAASDSPGLADSSTSSLSSTSPALPAFPALPDAVTVRDAILDRREIAAQTLAFRAKLGELEGVPDRAALRAKAEASMRTQLRAMPLRVYEGERVAEKARLSDACLALGGTYGKDLPRHAVVFRALGGDLDAMIQRLVLWAAEERSAESFFEIESVAAATQN